MKVMIWTQIFYLGTNNLALLMKIKEHFFLMNQKFSQLLIDKGSNSNNSLPF